MVKDAGLMESLQDMEFIGNKRICVGISFDVSIGWWGGGMVIQPFDELRIVVF